MLFFRDGGFFVVTSSNHDCNILSRKLKNIVTCHYMDKFFKGEKFQDLAVYMCFRGE